MNAPTLAPETAFDSPEVDALIDRAFGPGRYAKAAERLREGRAVSHRLSIVARDDGRLVGCVRQWPITVGETPALLLGPIAVDAAFRSHGLGAAMLRRAEEVATDAGYAHVVLVGDPPFFEPHGFTAAAARGVVFPGPVERGRLMARSAPAGPALQGPARVPKG